VGDAFAYLLLGGGEHKRLTKNSLGSGTVVVQTVAGNDFDVFA
jgi:hypothetical protein